MSIEQFIPKLADAIEADAASLSPDVEYKKLPMWDSLNALALIALADAEYDVTVTGRDIEATATIQSLWDLIESKGRKP